MAKNCTPSTSSFKHFRRGLEIRAESLGEDTAKTAPKPQLRDEDLNLRAPDKGDEWSLRKVMNSYMNSLDFNL